MTRRSRRPRGAGRAVCWPFGGCLPGRLRRHRQHGLRPEHPRFRERDGAPQRRGGRGLASPRGTAAVVWRGQKTGLVESEPSDGRGKKVRGAGHSGAALKLGPGRAECPPGSGALLSSFGWL
ncbi:hypothetical protein P7K49_012974 [Saguinus oedipus]|uniref:Uncharacterized protein n=1 Tax=Saguinus oedipus TaxID=9490 RepID=A0ABQ9VEL7_SAGOE|nr:hypothetical protein P7K49_012974 [Saguinus oedipus]